MSAFILPTRRSLRTRLGARLRASYLRWRIWHAELDMAQHEAERKHALEHLPKQIALDKAFIDGLTRDLARVANDF